MGVSCGMKVLVVQNGSQWEHRIWRRLRDLGVETALVPNTTPLDGLRDADGLVFSGGAALVGQGEAGILGNCSAYLDGFGGPVLGICAGQQLIATHFGGVVAPAKKPEFGEVQVKVIESDDLFDGLPEKFAAWASHNDEVVSAPGFRLLASSESVKWHAFKHESKPVYGTLFHPEVEHTEHGEEIFKNFLRVCRA